MELDDLNLLVVFVVVALAPLIADASGPLRLPVVVAEIALGMLVGPQLLDLADVDAVVRALANIGLAMLFFLAGLEIRLGELRSRRGTLAARGWLVSLGVGLVAAVALWAFDAMGAPLLVGLGLTTTALGALVPILRDAGLTERPLGRFALAAGAAGEFGPIVSLSLVLAVASGEPWRTTLLVAFAAAAIGVGLVAARARPRRVVRLVEATMHSSGQLALRLAVALLAALVVLAGELGLDVILGAFSAGLVTGLVAHGDAARDFREKLDGLGYGFLVPVFFVVTGMEFDLDALVADAGALLLVSGFAALFVLVRGLPALLLYRRELNLSERGALALLSASALPLVVAITEVATESGRLAESDGVALVGAAMLSLLVFPLVATALVRRRG